MVDFDFEMIDQGVFSFDISLSDLDVIPAAVLTMVLRRPDILTGSSGLITFRIG